MPVPHYIAGACVFALLTFAPPVAGATAPSASTAPAVLPQPSSSDNGTKTAVAVPKKKSAQQAAVTPKVKATRKKTQPAAARKASGGKKAVKTAQPAKTGNKSAAKPTKPAKPVEKHAAGKPKSVVVQKSEALKAFPVANVPEISAAKASTLSVAETWQPLMSRLGQDGVEKVYLHGMFGRLGDTYSHIPMGTKINELFTYKYMPKPPRKAPVAEKSDTPPVYKWALKPETVAKCKDYLDGHKEAFARMEKEYGVPKEVVAGLLMVETKLGAYLGASSSFWSLACLAASDTPERVDPALQALPLPMTQDKMEWVSKLLKERSVWAYKELLALITHCKANDLDPLTMPGSVYGAIGLCQFMPSNLSKFAVDGNKDGKIDLFEPADAIPSVGNYLKKHGWEGENRDAHHKVIKKYNKSNVYANTILALAEAIVAPPVDPAVAVASTDTAKKVKNGKTAKPAAKAPAKAKKPAGKKTSSAKKTSAKAKSAPAASSPASSPAQPDSAQPDPAKPAHPKQGGASPAQAAQPASAG